MSHGSVLLRRGSQVRCLRDSKRSLFLLLFPLHQAELSNAAVANSWLFEHINRMAPGSDKGQRMEA